MNQKLLGIIDFINLVMLVGVTAIEVNAADEDVVLRKEEDSTKLTITHNRLERSIHKKRSTSGTKASRDTLKTNENTTNPQQVPPTPQASHTPSTIKLPILKKGNGHVQVSTDTNGQIRVLPPKTAKEILGFHKGYDRFQSLLSQLETHGAGVSTKNANQKFLRSLPSFWSQLSLIIRTKTGVDTLNFDDLYNNLKLFKSDVKGSTRSSSSTQNVAFVSSDNTSSTNEVNTAYGVSTSSGHNSQKEGSSSYTDDLMYSFLANQSTMISIRLKKFYKKARRKMHFDTKEPVGFDKSKVKCINFHNTRHFARECRSKGNQDSRMRDAGNTRYKARDYGKRPAKQDEHKAMVTIDEEGVDWTGHAKDDIEDYALMDLNSSNSGSATKVTSCSNVCKESYAKLKKLYDEQREQLGVANIEIQAYTLALKKVEAQLVCHQKNQLAYEEKIRFMKTDLKDKTNVLIYHKKLLVEAVKEKQELKTELENFQSSFKGLSILLNSQMSAKNKSRLGYESQTHDRILSYETKVFASVFDSRSSNVEDSLVNDRFAKVEGIHAVPPPMTGNYMPPKFDFGIDESKITYGPKQSTTSESDLKPVILTLVTLVLVKKHLRLCLYQLHLNPKLEKRKGIVDSGCFRYMTGNKAYLVGYQDFNGGPVDFGGYQDFNGGPVDFGGSKGKIQTGKLDFEDVYFVKEQQHFNLFFVSQMCDKKNKVLFTDTKRLILSFDFKLPDENQVLLRVHRQHNMYSLNLENIVPSRGLACLIAKAIVDETTKWHRRNKKDETGIVVRNKARLVAQGHRQEEGIDYNEVFPHVSRIEPIRTFLAFAFYMGFIVYQIDVKSAFLYGKIDEEVYVSQPLGFIDTKFPNKVYKVVKALYGLHQALRTWYATLSTFLVQSGYKRGLIEKTLFIKKDIILMSSMGELTFFLRLQVKQKEDGIFISQDKYVTEILKKFDFLCVKTVSTSIETKNPLVKDEEAADVDVHLYRSMIGSLMYLIASRPNFIESSFNLEAYSDSDYTGANIDRKSKTPEGNFNKLDDLVGEGAEYAVNKRRSTNKIKVLNAEAEGVSAAGETLSTATLTVSTVSV
nr:putative ribonuclease H-like domain-containing protein [Tanacetum cinerariifolium]